MDRKAQTLALLTFKCKKKLYIKIQKVVFVQRQDVGLNWVTQIFKVSVVKTTWQQFMIVAIIILTTRCHPYIIYILKYLKKELR